MSESVLTSALILLGEHDISGDMNQVSLDLSADTPENTRFNDDTHNFAAGGLQSFTAGGAGFWEGGDDAIDDAMFAAVGAASRPLTIAPTAGADGDLAYLMSAIAGSYQPGAQIGELLAFSFGAVAGADKLVRGTVMHNATRTATVNGTARQLGAVAAGQSLYAALHVIGPVSGTTPTLDVVVESDDNSGMTSATSRINFAQATAINGQWQKVAGAITDDWWRITATIGGTTPSFPFVVVLGVR